MSIEQKVRTHDRVSSGPGVDPGGTAGTAIVTGAAADPETVPLPQVPQAALRMWVSGAVDERPVAEPGHAPAKRTEQLYLPEDDEEFVPDAPRWHDSGRINSFSRSKRRETGPASRVLLRLAVAVAAVVAGLIAAAVMTFAAGTETESIPVDYPSISGESGRHFEDLQQSVEP